MAARSEPAKSADTWAGRTFVFTRELDAPRPLVFQLWTDPKHVQQWWGPHGFTNPRCEWDARPGGAIHVDMKGPDGTVYPMTGRFREVVEPQRLVFTSAALDAAGKPLFEVLNTVTFVEQGGKTTVRIEATIDKVTPAAEQYLKGMDAGWKQTLDRLASHAATSASDREIVATRVFDAPRDLVFSAWTDPQHLGQWWGPRGFTTTTYSMDFVPGGVWRFVMHGPDGTDYQNKVTFVEIDPPRRLVYRHGGDKDVEPVNFQVTVTFEPEGSDKTRLNMRMVFPSAAAKTFTVEKYGAIKGLHETMGRLAEYVRKI